MSPETKAKRQKLSEISRKIKQLVGVGAFASINEGLIAMYSENKNLEFNTFSKWKEKGFIVSKGSKAFPVWGSKRKFQCDKSEDAKEFSFFPLCNLFSSEQVQQKENN